MVDVAVGNFSQRTSPGNQTISGLPFQPKVVMLLSQHSQLFSNSNNDQHCWGVAIGTGAGEQYCIGQHTVFGVGVSQGNRFFGDGILAMGLSGGSQSTRATLTAFTSDGFTLNFTAATTGGRIIHYMALAGDDLRVALTRIESGVSAGTFGFTGVGFKPNAIIPFTASSPVELDNTTDQARSAQTIGAGSDLDGIYDAAWAVHEQSGLGTTSTRRTQSIQLMTFPANDQASLLRRVNLISLDPDGFTLQYEDAPTYSYSYAVLSLGGITAKVRNILERGSPGSTSYTGYGFEPKGLILGGVGSTNFDNNDNGARHTMGFTDGVNQAIVAGDSVNNVGTANAKMWQSQNDVYGAFNAGQNSTYAQASFSTFDPDGFTLSWSKGNNATRNIWALAFTDGTGEPEPPAGNPIVMMV